MVPIPMPLLEAAGKKNSGTISWDQYIHNLLARCAGLKHKDDNDPYDYLELRCADRLSHSIWDWSKKVDNMTDITPLEAVFKAYRYGTFDEVKTKLGALDGVPAVGVNKSLALLALQDRRNDVLKYCLDRYGYPYDRVFYDEANDVKAWKDPETFRIVEQSEFRRCFPKGIGAPPGTAAVFDVGGRLPVDW